MAFYTKLDTSTGFHQIGTPRHRSQTFAAWDLGVGQNVAVGMYQRVGADYAPDRLVARNREGGRPRGHHSPRSSQRGRAESATGKTRLATARSLLLNVEWVVVPKLSVDDGTEKGRSMFVRLCVDEANRALWLDAIGQYHYEWDNRGMFLEKPYHDWTSHGADEHRYAAGMEDRMTNSLSVPPPTTGLVRPFYPGLGV